MTTFLILTVRSLIPVRTSLSRMMSQSRTLTLAKDVNPTDNDDIEEEHDDVDLVHDHEDHVPKDATVDDEQPIDDHLIDDPADPANDDDDNDDEPPPEDIKVGIEADNEDGNGDVEEIAHNEQLLQDFDDEDSDLDEDDMEIQMMDDMDEGVKDD